MPGTVTITVKDEVNVRFDGISPEHRRALAKKLSYEIPGARYLPSVRLGRWDGRVPYFTLAGASYVNLLDHIIPFLDERGYDVELNDERDYSVNFDLLPVAEDTFSDRTWPAGHPVAGQPIMLRDYQIEVVNGFLANPQCIQEVATGAGKTIMTAALSATVERHGRSIVIVPSKSLVTQTEADYINMGLDVGVLFGDRKEYNRTHTICTWQSLNALLKNTKSGDAEIPIGEFIEGVVCVIVDEVHSAKADALKTLLTGVFSRVPLRWGLTGTIPKEEYASTAIVVSIGPVISSLRASQLQDVGVLAKCNVNIIQLQDDAEFGDYQRELKYLLEDGERMDKIASMVDHIADDGNTLVLIDRLAAGTALQERLPDSVFIHGGVKDSTRKEEYSEVATVDNKVIIATYGVAAVGLNIPRLFNIVLIEPGKSFVRTIQSIGRGLRKAEDKDHVEIWDITSSCRFAKRHLTQRKAFYREANYPFIMDKVKYK